MTVPPSTPASCPATTPPERPALSVVIPMFQEESRITATVADVCATLNAWRISAEVLLVDDGCTDGTVRVARGLAGACGGLVTVRLLRHAANMGKGAAVRTGLRDARGGWVLFMDADNSTRLFELEALSAEARRTGAPIIIGSRVAGGSHVETTAARRAAGRAFHACLAALGLNLASDTQCGFKLYRADAAAYMAAHSAEQGFAFDVEHLLLARHAGIGVREVGVRWQHMGGGSIRVVRDGLKMLRAAVRIRRRLARATPVRFAAQAGPAPLGLLVEVKPLSPEPVPVAL